MFHFRSRHSLPPVISLVLRAAVLFLPAILLLLESLRQSDKPNVMLWMGTGFQVSVCILSLLSRRNWSQPIGPSVVVLYVIGLSWLWLGTRSFDDWYPYLARAILLVIPVVVFALQTLVDSGAPALRRANVLAQRLTRRKDWPADLAVCRALPEVKALRAALAQDEAPALALLNHPRPQVRVAALAALEFRKSWRPGQAEMVLHVAKNADEPAVRAAAATALGNLDDLYLIESVAEFMRDRSWEVRRAATEALLWDSDHRWSAIRHAVRRALADVLYINDGALRYEGQLLTTEAVSDLNAWAAEKGVLGTRAALTLGIHYARALNERTDPKLVQELRDKLADPHASAALRIELARLLQNTNDLDKPLLEKLLYGANPAPIRLQAAEVLLSQGEHAEAVRAVHDLARLPNREIALATADIVQRRLGVDLGLALGQPLPAVNSRLAAQVIRRLLAWSAPEEPRPPQAQPECSVNAIE